MVVAAQARPGERADFIRRTYLHLAGAVGAFILVEYLLFLSGIAQAFTQIVSSTPFSWLLVLGGFSLLGWFSRSLASKADSENVQYAGLGIYVVAQAIIFSPLIYTATVSYPDVLPTAGLLSLTMFGGLTAIALITQKDFSFLGSILTIGGFIALGLIACSVIFKFSLGLLFSVVMVVFASAAILYDTSNVLHHYSTRQHVAASLELFASVALLFWYILRVVMSLSRR